MRPPDPAGIEARSRQLRDDRVRLVRRSGELVRQSARARERRAELKLQRASMRTDLEWRWGQLNTTSGLAAAAIIEAAMNVAGCRVEDLWLDYFALGGNAGLVRFTSLVSGGAPLGRRDHDRIVQALNERMQEDGMGRPLAYWDGSR